MDFPTPIPFPQHLGFELLHLHPGEACVAVTLQPELGNAFGVAHGGLLMTLLDVALAHAARSPRQEGAAMEPPVVTLEMKTSFLRPGLGRLVATGRRLHHTASLVFCEGQVLGEEGQICATASGTFKVVRALIPSRKKANT